MAGGDDLTGRKFGNLLVVRKTGEMRHRHFMWECLCDCGEIKSVRADSLTSGRVGSCGCSRRRSMGHSFCDGKETSTYRTYRSMLRRCTNPKDAGYKWYGGRGIKVCDRWLHGENGKRGFACFLEDMGEKPDWADGGIDRIDNDGNYEPNNCRWATIKQQFEKRVRTVNYKNPPIYIGERNPQARLSEKDVITIIGMLRSGRYSHRKISGIYDCSKTTIGNIAHGKTWKHITQNI